MAEGHDAAGQPLLAPSQVIASAGYFEAMKIPIVRGRPLDERMTARRSVSWTSALPRAWGTRDPIDAAAAL